MSLLLKTLAALAIFFIFHANTQAQGISGTLTLKTSFNLWEMSLANLDLYSEKTQTFFKEFPIETLPDETPLIATYLENRVVPEVNLEAIEKYLRDKISPQIDRPKEDVSISMDAQGKVTFEGKGFYGRTLDVPEAAKMIAYAIKNDIRYITLPLIKEDPVVTVNSPELQAMGIKELITAGETNFANSPANRIININVGNASMNGRLVKPGEQLAFGLSLGEISGKTGYKPELVIKGDRTLPEYGGGLCQISTTAYRAALAGGFPITQRKNHSYAVSYYTPYGLDATIYPPSVDMKFVNDSPTHLLIHAFTDGPHVHYNFYGTKNNRKVYMVGPYNSQWISPPPARVEYSAKLAPGVKQELSHAVPGLTTNWYRQVIYPEEEKATDPKKKDILDHIFSKYQARPDYVVIGQTAKPKPNSEDLENGY